MSTNTSNPGGSLGDPLFPIPEFATLKELEKYMQEHHGYEFSNNMFFAGTFTGKKIAEVGCGHGLITSLLSSKCSSITGFDVDYSALAHAEKLKANFNLNNVKFILYDGSLEDYQENFDIAISMDVIEHVPDPVSYLKEIKKILRLGGSLFLGTPNGMIANKNRCIIKTHSRFHVMEYTPTELADFLREAGFKPVKVFANKNIAQKGYAISTARKVIIKLLCKVGLFEAVSRFLRTARSKKYNDEQSVGNSFNEWLITPAQISQISASNCDVTIFEATKT